MILNDTQIKENNLISPFDEKLLQSHSYDCTLYPILKIQDFKKDKWIEHDLNVSPLLVDSGQFLLGCTNEYLRLPRDIIGFVQGKSSIGRGGIQIECAGLVDPLFQGQITLELFNLSRWKFELRVNMPICQMWFNYVPAAEIKPYNKVGKYMYQTGATISR